jgi:hypothetical protein
MHRKVEARELRRQEGIEQLVDAIQRGEIAAIEDLDPEQVKLERPRAPVLRRGGTAVATIAE